MAAEGWGGEGQEGEGVVLPPPPLEGLGMGSRGGEVEQAGCCLLPAAQKQRANTPGVGRCCCRCCLAIQ